MVTLTICDLKQMGKVLDTLVREGGNRVHGIRFGVVNSKPLLDEARKLAVQDVKRKAALFAEAGDFRLGRMKTFTESSHSNHQYPKYAARAMAMEAAADVPVSGGELTFRVQVHVSWDIVCDVCEV